MPGKANLALGADCTCTETVQLVVYDTLTERIQDVLAEKTRLGRELFAHDVSGSMSRTYPLTLAELEQITQELGLRPHQSFSASPRERLSPLADHGGQAGCARAILLL